MKNPRHKKARSKQSTRPYSAQYKTGIRKFHYQKNVLTVPEFQNLVAQRIIVVPNQRDIVLPSSGDIIVVTCIGGGGLPKSRPDKTHMPIIIETGTGLRHKGTLKTNIKRVGKIKH